MLTVRGGAGEQRSRPAVHAVSSGSPSPSIHPPPLKTMAVALPRASDRGPVPLDVSALGGASAAWSPPRPGLGVSVLQPSQAGDTRSADGFRDVRRPVCGLSGDRSVLSPLRTGALPGFPVCLLTALLLVSCESPFRRSPVKVVPGCLSSLWAEKQAPQTGRLREHTLSPSRSGG